MSKSHPFIDKKHEYKSSHKYSLNKSPSVQVLQQQIICIYLVQKIRIKLELSFAQFNHSLFYHYIFNFQI